METSLPVEKLTTCVKCEGPLPPSAATGRPLIYCGRACRRAAEFEIRRVTRRLERLEGALWRVRVYLRQRSSLAFERHKAALEAEVGQTEARLRLLLSDPHVRPRVRSLPPALLGSGLGPKGGGGTVGDAAEAKGDGPGQSLLERMIELLQ